MFQKTGTAYLMAPEMLAGRQYTEKIDIWGAGAIFCFMLLQKLPLNTKDASNDDDS